jgi:hypothetical protein
VVNVAAQLLGAAGGRSRSKAKITAARQNVRKATKAAAAARRAKRKRTEA